MKLQILILLSIICLAFSGHIHVEEPVPKWSNSDSLSELHIRFACENNLAAGNYIIVTLPAADFGACSDADILDNAGNVLDSISCSGTTTYNVMVGTALVANTWYTLKLMISFTGSAPTEGSPK